MKFLLSSCKKMEGGKYGTHSEKIYLGTLACGNYPHINIEYRSDDVTTPFFAFERFEYHVSMEHDEKHPQAKFGGNKFMGPKI